MWILRKRVCNCLVRREISLLRYIRKQIQSFKAITIEDRDACCEAQSDSRLGTNTDFLDSASLGDIPILSGVCTKLLSTL